MLQEKIETIKHLHSKRICPIVKGGVPEKKNEIITPSYTVKGFTHQLKGVFQEKNEIITHTQ